MINQKQVRWPNWRPSAKSLRIFNLERQAPAIDRIVKLDCATLVIDQLLNKNNPCGFKIITWNVTPVYLPLSYSAIDC